jgi:uncharacterized protein
MNDDEFEWDDAKAKSNLRKHEIPFEIAKLVFDDAHAFEWADESEDYGEERFNVIGMVSGRLIVITYTMRGDKRRLISARKAEPRDKRRYHEQED